MRLTKAQREVLQRRRIYTFQVDRRTLDVLIRKGLVENVTEMVDGRMLLFAGIFTVSDKGRDVLASDGVTA
jgi:hypothetical protein